MSRPRDNDLTLGKVHLVQIEQRQQQIIDEFTGLAEWEDRYRRIIEYGRELAPMDPQHKIDKNKVKGCQSTVWLHAWLDNGAIQFQGDSDAMIVRGLIALLLKVYSGATPADVVTTPPTFVDATGLAGHLSQTRANGLAAMVKQIKMYAAVFQAMQKAGK
jgi:cysteine desulfuration protein SufE